jgi:hypothetical protein
VFCNRSAVVSPVLMMESKRVFCPELRVVARIARQAGYAILAAHVAHTSGHGVLALDYRTSQNGANPYPAAINDIIQALEWLELRGAATVSLIGDSSGGTQVKTARS